MVPRPQNLQERRLDCRGPSNLFGCLTSGSVRPAMNAARGENPSGTVAVSTTGSIITPENPTQGVSEVIMHDIGSKTGFRVSNRLSDTIQASAAILGTSCVSLSVSGITLTLSSLLDQDTFEPINYAWRCVKSLEYDMIICPGDLDTPLRAFPALRIRLLANRSAALNADPEDGKRPTLRHVRRTQRYHLPNICSPLGCRSIAGTDVRITITHTWPAGQRWFTRGWSDLDTVQFPGSSGRYWVVLVGSRSFRRVGTDQ